jgi:hypothetical protein
MVVGRRVATRVTRLRAPQNELRLWGRLRVFVLASGPCGAGSSPGSGRVLGAGSSGAVGDDRRAQYMRSLLDRLLDASSGAGEKRDPIGVAGIGTPAGCRDELRSALRDGPKAGVGPRTLVGLHSRRPSTLPAGIRCRSQRSSPSSARTPWRERRARPWPAGPPRGGIADVALSAVPMAAPAAVPTTPAGRLGLSIVAPRVCTHRPLRSPRSPL